MSQPRRHVQTYLGVTDYGRLRREAAARGATISKCAAECLREYFSLRTELRHLALSSCQLLDVGAGGFILTEGLPTDGLYIILEGQVEFFLAEHAGRGRRRPSRVRLNVLGPGRCFGEYGVVDDRPASASAQTLGPARLSFLPKVEFRRIIAQNDRIGKIVIFNLLRFLVGRLRGKDKELDFVLM